MKRINKHGYKQQENYLYEIEINEKIYSIEVDVTWFIKPADSSTWDSDQDFYGYTEVIDTDIVKIYTEDENQSVIEVEYTELSEEVQKEINAALDVLILEEQPSDEGDEVYD